jgi:sec-independent protein translocase protein TatA
MHLGVPELLLIFGIALLLFGPKKLGQLGKGLGEGIRNFKDGLGGGSKESANGAPPAESKPAASAATTGPTGETKTGAEEKK